MRSRLYVAPLHSLDCVRARPWLNGALVLAVDATLLVLTLAVIYFVLFLFGLGPLSIVVSDRVVTRAEQMLLAPWFGLGVLALISMGAAACYGVYWLARDYLPRDCLRLPVDTAQVEHDHIAMQQPQQLEVLSSASDSDDDTLSAAALEAKRK